MNTCDDCRKPFSDCQCGAESVCVPHGSRRAEVERKIQDVDIDGYDCFDIGEAKHLTRTLADEVDELRGKLNDVRMGIGCARGQKYCAEDEIITKLLELWHGIQGQYMRSINDYNQALEIAGRKE